MIKLFILHFLLKIVNSEGVDLDSPLDHGCEYSIWFQGECRDVYEDGACGEEALGERLYLGEDGEGYCDCDEGWVRYKERCYQEFTPAFCLGDNEILRLDLTPDKCNQILPDRLDMCLEGKKLNFSCLENPCPKDYYPHS